MERQKKNIIFDLKSGSRDEVTRGLGISCFHMEENDDHSSLTDVLENVSREVVAVLANPFENEHVLEYAIGWGDWLINTHNRIVRRPETASPELVQANLEAFIRATGGEEILEKSSHLRILVSNTLDLDKDVLPEETKKIIKDSFKLIIQDYLRNHMNLNRNFFSGGFSPEEFHYRSALRRERLLDNITRYRALLYKFYGQIAVEASKRFGEVNFQSMFTILSDPKCLNSVLRATELVRKLAVYEIRNILKEYHLKFDFLEEFCLFCRVDPEVETRLYQSFAEGFDPHLLAQSLDQYFGQIRPGQAEYASGYRALLDKLITVDASASMLPAEYSLELAELERMRQVRRTETLDLVKEILMSAYEDFYREKKAIKTPRVKDEYSPAKAVVLGTADFFTHGDAINPGMRKWYRGELTPTQQRIYGEYERIREILESFGIKVMRPNPTTDVPQQLTPRDIGIMIGEKFVTAKMTEGNRKAEIRYIRHVFDELGIKAGNIIETPENINWEAGNVIVDGKDIFIGINNRTSREIVDWFKDRFPDYQVHAIVLDPSVETHLDTVFKPIGKGRALLYTKAIKTDPDGLTVEDLKKRFTIIEVDDVERQHGGCNVFSVNENIILMRGDSELDSLRKRFWYDYGIFAFSVPFDESDKTGTGGPNCALLAMARG